MTGKHLFDLNDSIKWEKVDEISLVTQKKQIEKN